MTPAPLTAAVAAAPALRASGIGAVPVARALDAAASALLAVFVVLIGFDLTQPAPYDLLAGPVILLWLARGIRLPRSAFVLGGPPAASLPRRLPVPRPASRPSGFGPLGRDLALPRDHGHVLRHRLLRGQRAARRARPQGVPGQLRRDGGGRHHGLFRPVRNGGRCSRPWGARPARSRIPTCSARS